MYRYRSPFALILMMLACTLWGQEQQVTFRQITGLNGVTVGKINAIVQDEYGFVWLSDQTNRSIIRYDGTSMKQYKFDPDEPAGMGGYYPEALEVGRDGSIWIGYYGQGLDRFDPLTNSFTHYKHDPENPSSLVNNVVSWVLEDRDGFVWIGTNEGLDRLNRNTGTFKHFVHDPENVHTITGNVVRKIYQDREGILWVGTGFAFDAFPEGGGLNRYNPEMEDFTRYTHFRDDEEPGQNKVRAIFEDHLGNFWIGTRGNHVYRMDRKSGTFESFGHEAESPGKNKMSPPSSRNSHITFITEDADQQLWIGTSGEGLYRFNQQSDTLIRFGGNEIYPDHSGWAMYADDHGLLWLSSQDQNFFQLDIYSNQIPSTNREVTALYQESDQLLWIGTRRGLIREELGTGKEILFENISGDVSSISKGTVWHILKDHTGQLWVATNAGLDRLDPETKSFTHFRHEPDNPGSLASNDMTWMVEDAKNRLWIAHYENGLDLYLEAEKRFKHFRYDATDPNSHQMDAIGQLLADSDNKLWLALQHNDGLVHFDPENGQTKLYLSGLNSNAMIRDHRGILWVGTDNGLHYYDEAKDNFVDFDFDWTVGTLVEDDLNNIWVGSPRGLHMISADRSHISFLGAKNNVKTGASQEGGWYPAGTIKLQDGSILLGQSTGLFYHFYPEKIHFKQDTSKLYLTDFRFGNGGQLQPQTPPLLLHHIALSFDENIFGASFTEIDFTNDEYNPIYYKLEGYDLDWNETSSGNLVNYYRVPPGNYHLKIKAANATSGLETTRDIPILIHPPWWKTNWAYGLYLLVFLTGLWSTDRLMRRRIIARERQKARERELEQAREIQKAYEKLQATQSQLIHSEKMASLGELTAGIAHEIQNPLNFVNNFSEVNAELIEEQIEELGKGNVDHAKSIAHEIAGNERKIIHHGKRADAIVKSMLQHSRTSSGEKELTDINALCDEFLRLAYFGFKARNPEFKADLKTEFDPNLPPSRIVSQDIGRVLQNILNNAFSAVAAVKNPEVLVSTRLLDGRIEITITDNGPGIPENIKDKIFQPFFTTKPTGQGTGLGLSLSYDIVKAHGGDLSVVSEKEKYTSFLIQIPIKD